jgi:(2Fe-2S) ferredoxin
VKGSGRSRFDQLEREPLTGSVKLYHRHLFVCTGLVEWPARLEEGGGFLQALATVIKFRMPDMPLKVKMTACDEGSSGEGCDVLVFPDQIRYLGVRERDFPALVEDHLVGNQVSEQIPHEPLSGQHLFVCTHRNRDDRCGICGPPLIEGFKAILQARGLADQVRVRRTSHLGGHKYAGNVLIYPSGDWYGYVTPEDIARVVDEHILAGQLVRDLWRGRMGLSPEEQSRELDG